MIFQDTETYMDNYKEFDLITFGEIMLRLSPGVNELISKSDSFKKHAGGAELNVASGVSLLGLRTGVVTRLPKNQLGTFIKNRIRASSVSDDYIIFDDSPEAPPDCAAEAENPPAAETGRTVAVSRMPAASVCNFFIQITLINGSSFS